MVVAGYTDSKIAPGKYLSHRGPARTSRRLLPIGSRQVVENPVLYKIQPPKIPLSYNLQSPKTAVSYNLQPPKIAVSYNLQPPETAVLYHAHCR